ncbi:diacylglycerol kinase family protein [Peribacillus sp. SCS-155]|uniref:diacylglycerol kinase family protein n=1 Tax=Peribacillus sedimenti TaxID=3115297 RepID=UPI0039064F58
MKIHVFSAAAAALLGLYFHIAAMEWLFLLSAVAGMISLEMVNSALERAVDLATEDLHPLAKQAKDMAAGAVLIYAFYSVAVGLIIFLPRVFS